MGQSRGVDKKGRWEETNVGSGQRRGGIVWKGCVQVTGNAIEKQIVRMLSNCFELCSFALIESIGNSLRK